MKNYLLPAWLIHLLALGLLVLGLADLSWADDLPPLPPNTKTSSPPLPTPVQAALGGLAIPFIENRGQQDPAVAFYARAPGAAHFTPQSLHVIEPSGDRIHEIHAFVTPTLFPRFGLPPTLDSEQHRGAPSIE